MRDVLTEQVADLAKKMIHKQKGGRILIFTLYQYEAENLAAHLQSALREILTFSFVIRAYHGGMNDEDLKDLYDFWKKTDDFLKIFLVTAAFGTGLHVPDVYGVFHFCAANSLLQYIQEAGRAGRNGKPAQCLIIFNEIYANKHTAKVFKANPSLPFSQEADFEDRKHEWTMMLNYITQSSKCLKKLLFDYVDGNGTMMCIFDQASVNCDVCERYEEKCQVHESLLASQPAPPSPQPFLQPSSGTSRQPNDLTAFNDILTSSPIAHLSPLANGFQGLQTQPHPQPLLAPPSPHMGQTPFRVTPRTPSSHQPPTSSTPRAPLPIRRRLNFTPSQGTLENNHSHRNQIRSNQIASPKLNPN